jgi:hypothetical protein
MKINEELLERKVAAPVYKTDINDRVGSAALTTRHPSIHKSWHEILSTSGGRSVGIVRLRNKGHGVCLCVFVCLFVCLFDEFFFGFCFLEKRSWLFPFAEPDNI